MLMLWLFAGGAVGVLNALVLRWTVDRLRPGASPRIAVYVLGCAVLRLGLAISLLIAALQRGIAPALLAIVGLWLARWGTICWLHLRLQRLG
jgi:hypothetical protein